MKRLAAILLLLSCFGLKAIDQIEVYLTVTNTPTTGSNIVVNGVTRTWTNAHSATTILTNLVSLGVNNAATNLWNNFALYPLAYPKPIIQQIDTNKLKFTFATGYPGVITSGGGWASITNYTTAVTQAAVVRVPGTVESSSNRIHIASRLVEYIEYATNAFVKGWTAFGQFASLTNNNVLTGTNSLSDGGWNRASITNLTTLSGTLGRLTNGYVTNLTADSLIMTNGINYGNAFRSAGSGTYSFQVGETAVASGYAAVAVGNGSSATGPYSTAVGSEAEASGGSATAIGLSASATETNATAVGQASSAAAPGSSAFGSQATVAAFHTNSVAIGAGVTTTKTNQIMLGASTHLVEIPGRLLVTATITNPVVTGASKVGVSGGPYATLSVARQDISSMAPGANTLNVAGSSFVKVSGAGAPFSIVGITNGASGNMDGQLIMIENLSGDAMTIANQSGLEVVAANRIITGTGQDYSLGSNGVAGLIYDSAASRWVVMWRPRLLPVWGQINTRSNTIADPLATAGTFYQVTNFTAGAGNGVTVDTTNDRIQVGEEGTYEVGAHVSFSGTASETFTWAIHTNGVPVNHLYAVRALGTGGEVGALSFSSFVYLPTNCLVDLRVTSSSASDTITMTHGGLKVELKQ